MCRDCFCCLSAYECTCHDFLILNNLCKHIHAINISGGKSNFFGPLNAQDKFLNESHTSSQPNNTNIENTSINKSNNLSTHTLLEQLDTIRSMIVSKTTLDWTIAQLSHTFKNAQKLLEIDITQNNTKPASYNRKEPANKHIIQQKRFFSTKKESKTKKQKLQKPSKEEQFNITNNLLNELFISSNPSNDHNYTKT